MTKDEFDGIKWSFKDKFKHALNYKVYNIDGVNFTQRKVFYTDGDGMSRYAYYSQIEDIIYGV